MYSRHMYEEGHRGSMGLEEDPIYSWHVMILEFVLYCIAMLKTSLAKYLVNAGEAIQTQTSVVKR